MKNVYKYMSIISIFFMICLFFASQTKANLSDGLIAYYSFNGSYDDALGNYNLTGVGIIENSSNSIFDLALNFTGDTSTHLYSTDGLMNYNDSRTFCSWMYQEQLLTSNYYRYFILSTTMDGTTDDIWFDKDNGADFFRLLTDNGFGGLVTYENTSSFEWIYWCFVFDGTNSTIFADGNNVASGSSVFSGSGTRYLLLGGYNGCSNGAGCMVGLMDEVGIWNRSLNDSEISLLYDSGNGLQYPFNETEPEPCEEDWITNNTACVDENYTIQYYDANMCGTFEDLPLNNGTIVSCAVIPTTPIEEAVSRTNNTLMSVFIVTLLIAIMIAFGFMFIPALRESNVAMIVLGTALVICALIMLFVSLKMLSFV